MADAKTCPKCKGMMAPGKLLKYNEFVARNQNMYVFAPDDEPGPDLSKLFSGKPLAQGRKPLVAHSCVDCGFTEFYGVAAG